MSLSCYQELRWRAMEETAFCLLNITLLHTVLLCSPFPVYFLAFCWTFLLSFFNLLSQIQPWEIGRRETGKNCKCFGGEEWKSEGFWIPRYWKAGLETIRWSSRQRNVRCRGSKCRKGSNWLGGSIAEEDLGVFGASQTPLASATGIIRHIRCTLREVRVPLYSALVRFAPEYCRQSWAPYLKKHMEKLEKGQRPQKQ